jgi:hypothetical protein
MYPSKNIHQPFYKMMVSSFPHFKFHVTSKENFSEIKNSGMPFNLYAYKPFIFNYFYVFISLTNIRVIKSKTVVF